MPYYRHKIIANNKNYKPLTCLEYDCSPKYTWHNGHNIDLSFQKKDIEKQYQICTVAERRWNLQLASTLYFLLSLILTVYFVTRHLTSDDQTDEDFSLHLFYAAVATAVANLGLIVISHTLAHHSLTVASFFTLLVGFIPSFVILHFGREILSPLHLVFVWSCPLLISYTLLYLPLLCLMVMGVLYAVGVALHAKLRTDTDTTQCVLYFLTLLGVNFVGVAIRFYDELTSLIKSIMPEGVCQQILDSGMLHDVVLCKDPEYMMRTLPIKLMEPVSILFADLVGFTAMSSTLLAPELVSLLTDLYGRFDCVAEAYNCENISILGDCYFAVSGCPEADERHADNCMYTGVGLITATREFCQQRNKSIDIRVGIHTGIVLCGIVGGTKFKYDVWSSDAKLANYMESGGVPGRVHISDKTKGCLKDDWDFEEGFGSKREPELQGIRTWLLKQEFQDTVVIEPKKKDISETAIYKTVQKTKEKKRGSSAHTSKDFDGSVSLQHVISNEELYSGYTLLPVLHPSIALQENKGSSMLNGAGSNYKCITNATVSPAQNGSGTANGNTHAHEEGRGSGVRKRGHSHEVVKAASQPWPVQRTFRKEEKFKEDKAGCSLMINPLTAMFRSTRVKADYLRHGWNENGCTCLFSRGLTFFSCLILCLVSVLCLAIVLHTVAKVPVLVVEVVTNTVILIVTFLMFARWKRIKKMGFLEKLNTHIPFPLIPVFTSLLLLIATFTSFGLAWGAGSDTNNGDSSVDFSFVLLPVVLVLAHFLLYHRVHWVIETTLLMLTAAATVVFLLLGTKTSNDAAKRGQEFAIVGVVCLLITVLVLSWVRSVKNSLRFGTLQECSTELSVMKEEEKVTTQLFNTIIPKHVSDQFLSELRYSHSYEHVGVIFASVTNFWDFYEEKFEGGMGCIRVLNEIVRDIDDLLMGVENARSDVRWAAIQKIKTVGPCYMAASGLDPVTEEQTRQGNHEHIVNLMDFCFKILDTIKQFNSYTFGTNFTMKIGFNYGPVTDGIIGQNKVLYDIWGDTVNLASRMMSTGVVGRIQLPAACLPYLIDHFKLPKRGKVRVKGKGDMITHFCVERKSAEQIRINLENRAANC
ncbi:hypothetical protein ACHWQZ_G005287 [Mnemiopsis leidyi]